MAVQSSPSQQPLEDHLRMGQNVNSETLSMSAPIFKLERRRNETLGALENYRSIKSKRKSLIVDLDVQSPGGKK